MQLHRLAVNAHVRDPPAGRDDGLADVEGRRNPDRFDGHVGAGARAQLHHLVGGLSIGAVDQSGRAKLLSDREALVVQVDHDDRARRVELCREQHGEPDGSRAHDRDRVARLHLSVENAALEACRQNVAQHHEGFLVSAGEGVEAAIGMRDADVLGLGPVDGVAQNPAAVAAMGIHPSLAEVALQAGRDARDEDSLSRVKAGNARSQLFDDADPFVAENAAVGHGRDVSLQDVKIGSADRRRRDSDDGVTRTPNGGPRLVLPRMLAGTVKDERLHGGGRSRGRGARRCELELFGGGHGLLLDERMSLAESPFA